MPTCNYCEKRFPNRVEIDGRERVLHRRKFCLTCSPFGSRNTRKFPPILNIESKREFCRKNPTKFICKTCNKTRNQVGTNIECSTCRSRKQREKKRKRAIDILGGKCLECGYNGLALTFHHVNPNNKKFNLSSGWGKSWKTILDEIKKCILLCSNCHIEVHRRV